MRTLVPALLLMIAAFAAGALLTKTSTPAVQPVATGTVTHDDQALAAMRKDSQLLRDEIAVLASEVAQLRTSLQDRPASAVIQAFAPAQVDMPDTTLATKPAKDALEHYRAATGNQRPANLADLVPFFTDPQQAEAFLKNREAAAAAKPERQQVKAEVKTELKQRRKAGPAAPAAP